MGWHNLQQDLATLSSTWSLVNGKKQVSYLFELGVLHKEDTVTISTANLNSCAVTSFL